MLRAIIVDDEAPARDELVYLLAQEQGIEVAGEAADGAAAVALAAQTKPDVVFLDIELRGMNGLETARVLRELLPQTMIVFATAYDSYALQAFELGALDYLLKPFEQRRLKQTLLRLQNYRPDEWRQAGERLDAALDSCRIKLNKLAVEKDGKIVLLRCEDLLCAQAQGKSVAILTANGEYGYAGTLAELEQRLRGTAAMRVHKSFVVNLDKVTEVVPWFKGTYWLRLSGRPELEIPVSKSQIKALKEALGLCSLGGRSAGARED